MKYQFTKIIMTAVLGMFFSLAALADHHASSAPHWIKKSQSVKGSWHIETRDDGDYLVLSSDFKTRKGPDLKLMLTKLSSDEVTGKNATSSSITIAPLTSPQGGQSYKLPADYTDYNTLLIHCEKYSKLWGASDFGHHSN